MAKVATDSLLRPGAAQFECVSTMVRTLLPRPQPKGCTGRVRTGFIGLDGSPSDNGQIVSCDEQLLYELKDKETDCALGGAQSLIESWHLDDSVSSTGDCRHDCTVPETIVGTYPAPTLPGGRECVRRMLLYGTILRSRKPRSS